MTLPLQFEYDLTVVVIAQSEGLVLHRTLRSIQVALDVATSEGISAEILVVLDTPSPETKALGDRYRGAVRLLEVDYHDPGRSGNFGVERAQGRYLCFVSADALVGREWFRSAYQRAIASTQTDFVIHPAVTLEYGTRVFVHEHLASQNPRVKLAEFVEQKFWTNNFLAARSTLVKIPLRPCQADSGFSHSVGHWYGNLIAAGGEVLIAPETCVLVRNGQAQLIRSSFHKVSGLMRPSELLEPRSFTKLADRRSLADARQAAQTTNPESSPSLMSGLRLLAHSVPGRLSKLTESYPPLQKSLGYAYRKLVGPVKPRSRVPAWLLAQWEGLAVIDPVIYPGIECLTFLEWLQPSRTPVGQVYEAVCRSLAQADHNSADPQFTHVYLLPWLKRGGAEHVAIHYIQMAASCSSNRVLVILTDGSEVPWKERIPASVEVFDYWAASRELDVQVRQRLLAQLLVQFQPRVVHLVNSQLGSQMLVRYGQPLASIARLYAPAFCADVSPEGKLMSYVVTYLPKYARYLTAIHSDNQSILNYLEETFALDPTKMFVHYQPVRIEAAAQLSYPHTRAKLQVLWAGRLDRQKRPDLLLVIAQECLADEMHFHVYGSSQLEWEKAQVDFESLANVTYHGPFDSLRSVPTAEFDLFLNTSQWDGMPNILLEAAALGLPLVSSNVGGIGELIQSEENGVLVTPFDDVSQYVTALRRLKNEPELRAKLATNCRQLIAERHSWEHFAADVDRFPGYCDQPIQLANVFNCVTHGSSANAPLEAEGQR